MTEMAHEQNRTERITYKDSTYEIVSKVAYLIGVPKRIFENEHEPPQIDVYRQLDLDKNARIIRHLCIVRTSIERNFKYINDKMRTEFKSILSLPQFVPAESISQLSADGINFVKKSSTQLSGHIVEINRIISDRINNCKNLFPLWLNWQYVRELFIMPDGLREESTKDAAAVYYNGLSFYPYQMYISWIPQDEGNILYSDKKFVTLLYQWHLDEFTDLGKVSDAGSLIKGNIYDFIDEGEKVVIVVDCENVDPYKLSATLRGLSHNYTDKIASIILFAGRRTRSTPTDSRGGSNLYSPAPWGTARGHLRKIAVSKGVYTPASKGGGEPWLKTAPTGAALVWARVRRKSPWRTKLPRATPAGGG